MSISNALNNAGTGLAAAARAIQVSSGNVANAMTPGYAPRSLHLSAASLGGFGSGVRMTGIERHQDPILQGMLRTAGAAVAQSDSQTRFWSAIETGFGLSDAPGSLASALDRVAAALLGAADRPDLDSRLSAVVEASSTLVHQIGKLEQAIQARRLAADSAIDQNVAALNDGLQRLHRLNTDITRLDAAGHPTLDLKDERDTLLGTLSEIVPLRAHLRPEGRMMVFTESGTVLLDLRPVEIGFSGVAGMTPDMTLAGGQLSGLTINGIAVSTGPNGPLSGGRLGMDLVLRDQEGPSVQDALDSLAESLIARFQDPATDPTTPVGAPGLFTDAGLAIGAAPPPGLAGRLSLSATIDPAAGGQLWRLRDGLGAALPGPVGETAQLGRWIAALDRPVASEPGASARSLAQELAETLSGIGQRRQTAVDGQIYATTVQDALRQQQLDGGVDIDAEMRRLMLIETAYAANARVIQIADEMLRRLMEI